MKYYVSESYGDFLPHPDEVPKAYSVGYGIVGVSHDGDIYCPECAIDMGLLFKEDGVWTTLNDGWTGIVDSRSETDSLYHCGNNEDCLDALDGDEHPYDHDKPVGIGIDESVQFNRRLVVHRWDNDNIPEWSVRILQRARDGLVYSIETNTNETLYGEYEPLQVVTLPENFEDDNQIIEVVGTAKDMDEAMSMIAGHVLDDLA